MKPVSPGQSVLTSLYPNSVFINKDIFIFWKLEENDTVIEMAVELHKSTGWLAVAIGPYDAGHIRSDMIVGMPGGVSDRYSYKKEEPHIDKQYNIISGSMNVTQSRSLLVFTRKLKTPDKFEDREIYTSRTTKMAYAWGDMENNNKMHQHPDGAYGTLFVNFKTGQSYKYSGAPLIAVKFAFIVGFFLVCLVFSRFIIPWPLFYKLRKQYYIFRYWKYSGFDFLLMVLLAGMNVALFFIYNDPRNDVGINIAALAEFCIALVFLTLSKSPHFNKIFGVSYERQLKYHRLYAWAAFAVITAHAVATMINFGSKGTLGKEFTWSQNIFGIIAYAVLLCITILTAHFVRRKMWEWFKYSHFLFYLFLLIGTLHATNFIYFCLPGLVLYLADRVYRFIVKYKVKAQVVGVELRGGNVMVLKIHSARKYHPGQFFQLSFPEITHLESHPYSISSAPADENITIHAKSLGKWSERVVETISSATKIRLEGPFGITANWRHKEVVVLFSGGIGATPYISIVRDHILSPDPPRPTHLYFYPTFSSASDLDWFRETWDLVATDPSVTMQRYVSQQDKIGSNEMQERGMVDTNYQHGRPPIHDLLVAVCNAHPNTTNLLVMACGPGAMWRSVQKECYKVSKETGKKLYFSHEVFKF
eukprot:Phypoly_transcript_04410.p1 GENE.Phypoly_transcript_04410~~Phypoly_transcript_04410.p1  ORF type:complete len:712 (+),score=55.65 Phypoly_transcript_04410:200-2137(+)